MLPRKLQLLELKPLILSHRMIFLIYILSEDPNITHAAMCYASDMCMYCVCIQCEPASAGQP